MSQISGKQVASISLAIAAALTLSVVVPASAKGPVVHHVSAGGPDACVAIGFEHPGCNGNYSLVGNVKADGSMTGQYIDRFAKGDGFHAVVDCISIVGNDAWISGVITEGTLNGVDLSGQPVATRVRDNGTSANDVPDQISFSFIGDPRSCTLHLNYQLLDAPEGQVTVD